MPGGVGCAHPITLSNGNVFEQAQDYSTVGQNPLSFVRYYNSLAAAGSYAAELGANWRHIYDRYLHIINPSAIYGAYAERADGQYVTFSSYSGTYTTDPDLDYALTVSGSTWTLTDPDDTVETYSQSGAEATLQSIRLRNGYTQTMHYTSGRLSSVTDTYGRSLGLSYSSAGLLTNLTTPDAPTFAYAYVSFGSAGHLLSTVTYNTSPTTSQTYSYSNVSFPTALTGITDENGHTYASWTYDSTGRGTTSQFAGGVNFTSVSYFDSNGQRNVTGPLGIAETYKSMILQGVPKVTEIDRASNGTVAAANEKFAYNSNGYTQSVTDWNGNQTYYTNNSHGLPTQIIYASGSSVTHTTNITYDGTWARLAHIITTPGLTTTLNYDSSGNLSTRVDTDTTSTSTPYSTNGQTRTWTYTYTSTGQLTSVRLPRTDVYAKTAYGYSGGVLNFSSDALGHTITANTFTPGGRWTKVTDQNGVQTQLAYSSRLWLTSSVLLTSAGNLTTSLQYDSAGQLTKFTRADSSYLAYAYNNAHQLTTITNALSETENLSYNSAGNLTQTLWKTSGGTTKRQHSATFDALGRMLTDVGGASQTTTYSYDNNGNWVSITDPRGHVSYRSSDALNRMTKFKDQVKNLTQIAYDAHNRPLTVTDPKGNATTSVYDGWGDMIQEANPDAGTSVFWYDPDSNVTTKKDADIHYTSATYDALDRPLTRTYPADSSQNVAFTYDQGGHGKGVGHLTSMTDPAGSLSRSYDERGNLITDARTTGGHTYTTSYTFESAGRLASVTYASSGWLATYSRDAAGQVSSITDKQPGHSPTNIATSITHMPFGPVSGFTYGNGVTDARTYDLDYRLTSIKDTGTGGNIQYSSYGYDASDNVTSVTDHVTPGWTQGFTYSNSDQINYASGPYGVVSTIKYDLGGNWTKYDTTTYTPELTSNRFHKMGPTTIVYDSAGRMTTGVSSSTMTYNLAGQLATVNVFGSTGTYVYDGFGWRVTAQTGTGPTITQTYDQAGHYLERSAHDVSTDYVWLDGLPVAAIKPTATPVVSALHTNNIGAPVKATSAAQGSVWTAFYAPCGVAGISGATITNDLRYPGVVAVSGSNFMNDGFRDNSTQHCIYMEPDLIGSAGGTNRYTYAANNPLKYTDRLGLDGDPDPNADNETSEEQQEDFFGPVLRNDPNIKEFEDVYGKAQESRAGEDAEPAETESNPGTASPDAQVFMRYSEEDTSPTNPPGMQCTAGPAATNPLLEAGEELDRGGELTKAGRALQKHGSRPDSVFPPATGNPAAINQQGRQILEEILNSENQAIRTNKRFGGTDIIDLNTGRGARYDTQGNLRGFIQVPRGQ